MTRRYTKYTPELADLICERVASHPWGLKRLCTMYSDMPDKMAIYNWRNKYPDFQKKYAEAKLKQAEYLAEEILDIAYDDSQDLVVDNEGNERLNFEFVARARLKIDTLKWMAGKLLPKTYGKMAEEAVKTDAVSAVESLLKLVTKNEQ